MYIERVFKLLSLVTPAQSLTEEDHFKVFPHLNRLSKEELVLVGTALGLLYTKCTDMSKGQIVSAWLKGDGNVKKDGKDSRTWDTLITTLKKCGHNGIAEDVQKVAMINKACIHEHSIIFFLHVAFKRRQLKLTDPMN